MTAPTDRVQVLKQETTSLGGQDAESTPWPEPINPQEDAIEVMGVFLQDATNRDEQVYIARATGRLVAADASNAESPVVTELVHAALRQLVHLADGGGPWEAWASGSFRENLPTSNPFPTSIIWWTDNTKTRKIVAKLITYDGQKRVTQIQWTSYASDGTTAIAQVTDNISYSAVFETNRTRTVT